MSTRLVSALPSTRCSSSVALAVIFSCSVPAHAWAQASSDREHPPTFRTGVSSVLVDTLVLDEDGHPVSGLSVEDFTVLEDGVLQDIRSFSVTDWTSYVGARDRSATGVAGADGASPNRYPRRFIFVYNRQCASFNWLARAKLALMSFVVESMADGDEAMLIDIGHTTKIIQQFRNTKEATLESVRSLSQVVVGGGSPAARTVYQRLTELGEGLEPFPGRKVVVLLSNELPTFRLIGRESTFASEWFDRAVESLNRANASVYTIDLRGPRSTSSVTGGLAPLADETGGRHFRNTFVYETPLRSIGRENGRYYLLGYTSTNETLDGAYRSIEVVVNRPKLEVVARYGYFAGADDGLVAKGRR